MENKPLELEAILLKYPQIEMRDFIMAQMAAKIQVLELILVDKLYQNPQEKQKAFDQADADFLRMVESYVVLIVKSRGGGASGSDESAARHN